MGDDHQRDLDRQEQLKLRQEQLKLSETCEELLKSWYTIPVTFDEEAYEEFWLQFRNVFYKEANKLKEKYNIEYTVGTLTQLIISVQWTWTKMLDYRNAANEDKEREANGALLLQFNSIITEVEKIKDKALQVEGKIMIKKMSPKWASQLLTHYYRILMHLAVLDYIIANILNEYHPDRLKLSLLHQENQLREIKYEISNLTTPDIPPEIVRRISNVSDHVATLIGTGKEQMDDAEKKMRIHSRYGELGLQGEILQVYLDSLQQSFQSE